MQKSDEDEHLRESWIGFFFISSRTKIFLSQSSFFCFLMRPCTGKTQKRVKKTQAWKTSSSSRRNETNRDKGLCLLSLSLSLHLNARVLLYNTHKQVSRKQKIMAFVAGGISTLRISAANHVRPKGAKESRKNRPVKHRPSDKNRAPTNYPTVDPAAVPPVYTIVSEAPKKTD